MTTDIVCKEKFSVIGKLGEGDATKGSDWIPHLWEQANGNFHEISLLAKKDENGIPTGIWGAMSDAKEWLLPWKERGKYLAGCEVYDDSVAPIGWVRWTIPSYKYIVTKCSEEIYGEIFGEMIHSYLPSNNYQLVGAVHEFYSPLIKDGFYLYFPIEKL